MARSKLSNKAFAPSKLSKTLWSGVTETVRLSYSNVTTIVFFVTWIFIYILMFSFPPKHILMDSDFMKKEGTTITRGVNGDGTKKVKDARYSDKGKQIILGWSALFAFIVALCVHFLQMYLK